MRDPHVVALHYEIGTEGDDISFGDPPDVTITNHLGVFVLSKGKLTIRPSDHYAKGSHAQAVFEPYLRDWEMGADLTSTRIGSIRFKYVNVEKTDRAPPATGAGPAVMSISVGELVTVGFDAAVHITQQRYPAPPDDFRTTLEVKMAYDRWRAYRERRETLQAMAYFVLTLVEGVAGAGNRRTAASTLNVGEAILSTIGKFSSTRGDGDTARKFPKAGETLRPLSGGESSWLEDAIRRLVRRLGEHAAGGPLAQLTMGDLPRL